MKISGDKVLKGLRYIDRHVVKQNRVHEIGFAGWTITLWQQRRESEICVSTTSIYSFREFFRRGELMQRVLRVK